MIHNTDLCTAASNCCSIETHVLLLQLYTQIDHNVMSDQTRGMCTFGYSGKVWGYLWAAMRAVNVSRKFSQYSKLKSNLLSKDPSIINFADKPPSFFEYCGWSSLNIMETFANFRCQVWLLCDREGTGGCLLPGRWLIIIVLVISNGFHLASTSGGRGRGRAAHCASVDSEK